jgi:exonuclease III
MDSENFLVWNVRDLNGRARRALVAGVMSQERVSVVCLQETMLDVMDDRLILELLGSGFSYVFLPSVKTRGGIRIAWRSASWCGSQSRRGDHALTIRLTSASRSSLQWWLSVVYGPHRDQDKRAFLNELQGLRSAHLGPWLVCGDFNLIYRAADKNNTRLNLSLMAAFRNALNSMELTEPRLQGRLFTWSNEQQHPTLSKIDCAFACMRSVHCPPLPQITHRCSFTLTLLRRANNDSTLRPSGAGSRGTLTRSLTDGKVRRPVPMLLGRWTSSFTIRQRNLNARARNS